MKAEYADWLQRQGYDAGTVNAQIYRSGRVEEHYGDLDQHFARDRGRPNPSKIPFEGDIRNNLAAYKNAVVRYPRFLETEELVSAAEGPAHPTAPRAEPAPAPRPLVRPAVPKPIFAPRTGARTLVDFSLDGREALNAIIAASQYRTIAQAVASLTLFSRLYRPAQHLHDSGFHRQADRHE